jgi:hypothetical protein
VYAIQNRSYQPGQYLLTLATVCQTINQCCGTAYFDVDLDPDPACHFDAAPGPDPDPIFTLIWIRILASKSKLKTLKKCSNRRMFRAFWLVICILMLILIRIQPITLMRIRIRNTAVLTSERKPYYLQKNSFSSPLSP